MPLTHAPGDAQRSAPVRVLVGLLRLALLLGAAIALAATLPSLGLDESAAGAPEPAPDAAPAALASGDASAPQGELAQWASDACEAVSVASSAAANWAEAATVATASALNEALAVVSEAAADADAPVAPPAMDVTGSETAVPQPTTTATTAAPSAPFKFSSRSTALLVGACAIAAGLALML